MSNMINAQKETTLSVLSYNGSKVAFETINGKVMVNATQMAKPFGKQPIDWLKTQQSKELIETISKVRKISLAEIQQVRRGGSNPGTFFNEDLALLFAQWLSPAFYLACNTKLKELLTQQTLSAPTKFGINATLHNGEFIYPYSEACKKLGKIKYPRAGKRRKTAPQHFRKLFGRNFITEHYLNVLKGYYDYKLMTNQLKLAI